GGDTADPGLTLDVVLEGADLRSDEGDQPGAIVIDRTKQLAGERALVALPERLDAVFVSDPSSHVDVAPGRVHQTDLGAEDLRPHPEREADLRLDFALELAVGELAEVEQHVLPGGVALDQEGAAGRIGVGVLAVELLLRPLVLR